MAHFGAGGRHLLGHAGQHMAPDLGLAEGHGMERQAQTAVGDPGARHFARLRVMEHLMRRLQLMRMRFVAWWL